MQTWRQLLTAVGHTRDLNKLTVSQKKAKIFCAITLKFISWVVRARIRVKVRIGFRARVPFRFSAFSTIIFKLVA